MGESSGLRSAREPDASVAAAHGSDLSAAWTTGACAPRSCGLVVCRENDVNSRPQADIARILLIIVILSLLIFGSDRRRILPASC